MNKFIWLFNIIKALFKKKEVEVMAECVDMSRICADKHEVDLKIPIERIINEYDPAKKNIIIIDDSRGIVSIIEDIINDIEKEGIINLDEYNILTFYDKYAPFVLKRTLESIDIDKIDYAIIDIVLPGKMNLGDKLTRLDGIDVAILLNEEYKCHNLCFYTGNVISEYVDYIKLKVNKFENNFDEKIDRFIIFKGNKNYQETKADIVKLFKKEEFQLKG